MICATSMRRALQYEVFGGFRAARTLKMTGGSVIVETILKSCVAVSTKAEHLQII